MLYGLYMLAIASSCKRGVLVWACSVASTVCVCVRVCERGREAAVLLWMLISSGLWWCHTLWCHTRWDEPRGETDKGIKQKSTGSPLMLVRSHTSPCTSASFKCSKITSLKREREREGGKRKTVTCSLLPAQLSLVVMATATGSAALLSHSSNAHIHTHTRTDKDITCNTVATSPTHGHYFMCGARRL